MFRRSLAHASPPPANKPNTAAPRITSRRPAMDSSPEVVQAPWSSPEQLRDACSRPTLRSTPIHDEEEAPSTTVHETDVLSEAMADQIGWRKLQKLHCEVGSLDDAEADRGGDATGRRGRERTVAMVSSGRTKTSVHHSSSLLPLKQGQTWMKEIGIYRHPALISSRCSHPMLIHRYPKLCLVS